MDGEGGGLIYHSQERFGPLKVELERAQAAEVCLESHIKKAAGGNLPTPPWAFACIGGVRCIRRK